MHLDLSTALIDALVTDLLMHQSYDIILHLSWHVQQLQTFCRLILDKYLSWDSQIYKLLSGLSLFSGLFRKKKCKIIFKFYSSMH